MSRFTGLIIAGPKAGESMTHDRPYFELIPQPMLVDLSQIYPPPARTEDFRRIIYRWDEGFEYFLNDRRVFSGPLWLLEGWTTADATAHLYQAYSHYANKKPPQQEQLVLEEIHALLKEYDKGNAEDETTLRAITTILKKWGFKL